MADTDKDESPNAVLGEVAVYLAPGLDPDTPACQICGDGTPARFRLTRPEGTVTRLCAVHLMASVEAMLGPARESLLRLLRVGPGSDVTG